MVAACMVHGVMTYAHNYMLLAVVVSLHEAILMFLRLQRQAHVPIYVCTKMGG